MERYTYTKIVNTDKLEAEIKMLNLPYVYMDTKADQVYIWVSQGLSDVQESVLTAAVESHDPIRIVEPVEIVRLKILKAMDFGRNLTAMYGAQNILAGFTVEEIQQIILKTQGVSTALLTGSLYVALDELSKVETDDVLITSDKVTDFRHKIQDYLQIPRT